MDPRITAYLDRREYWEIQEAIKKNELGNLLLQAQEVPFPEHVRPAVAEDIIPGAVIWFAADGVDTASWAVIIKVGNEPVVFTPDDGELWVWQGLNNTFVEEAIVFPPATDSWGKATHTFLATDKKTVTK